MRNLRGKEWNPLRGRGTREADIERRNVTRMEGRMIAVQFHDLF